MRIRTLLLIVAILGVSLVAAFLFEANREVLRSDFYIWKDVTLPVGLVLLGFLLGGMLVTFLAGMAREAGLFLERRRRRKEGRKLEEIEEEYSRGLVAVLDGRTREALAHFRAVLERDSRHFNTLLKLGEVLRLDGRIAEAIEVHRKAHHIKEEDTRPLYELVEDHEAAGDMDRARAVLGKLVGIQKQSVTVWRRLRKLHIKERSWDKALEAHKQVEKLGDDGDVAVGLGIRFEIAAAHLEAGRHKDALSTLKKLLKAEPNFIPAHVKLGEVLRAQGQDAEAHRAWFRGFEATGSPIFLRALEEHYLQREEPLRAIEALKQCVAASSNDTLAKFYLGKLYFRLEMLDDALAVLSSLAGRASYAPSLHYLIGRIHERRRNPARAAEEYRRVIRETDLVQLEYACRSCGETIMEWSPRCPECGEWNTVEVNFREEISYEELGIAPAPIYE